MEEPLLLTLRPLSGQAPCLLSGDSPGVQVVGRLPRQQPGTRGVAGQVWLQVESAELSETSRLSPSQVAAQAAFPPAMMPVAAALPSTLASRVS